MAKFISKYLGELALMTAAVLWAGCGDSDKKANESAKSQTVQEQSKKAFADSVKDVKSKYLPVRDSSITSETISGVTVLYGTTRCRYGKPIGDSLLYGLLYGSGGGIMAKTKGAVQVPKESDIVIEKGYNLDERSVLKTFRQRTPGLRHIYNKNLKKKPEFSGTIVLKLKVDEQGAVEKVEVDSSTTGYDEFDEDIRRAVSRWKFEKKKVRGTFKIPLTFYENE